MPSLYRFTFNCHVSACCYAIGVLFFYMLQNIFYRSLIQRIHYHFFHLYSQELFHAGNGKYICRYQEREHNSLCNLMIKVKKSFQRHWGLNQHIC
jgi:hypothetical protein